MALANVAWILAAAGKRVIMLDWDLEAPGLHWYFRPLLLDPELKDSDGIIDFVIDYSTEALQFAGETVPAAENVIPTEWVKSQANLLYYKTSIDCRFPNEGRRDLVPAGRQGTSYPTRVNTFDWRLFYSAHRGGPLLDAVAARLREEYDYILIDSRTGVNDTSGICTIQLPDVLVVCFTLNNQGIIGASSIAEVIRKQRPDLAIWPVPMRVELGEKKLLDDMKEFAWSRFKGLLQPGVDPVSYWRDMEVPYLPRYAYRETLAPFEKQTSRISSILPGIELLSRYVTDGAVTKLQPLPEDIRSALSTGFEQDKPVPETVSTAFVAGAGVAEPEPPDQSGADVIIATKVGALIKLWPERPPDLIAVPLPAGITDAVSVPLEGAQAVQLRVLIAISEPAPDGDLNDEFAIVQETLERRLPPSWQADVWRWDFERRAPVPCAPPSSDSAATPPLRDFDALILIAWRILGPRRSGLDDLERDTREYPNSAMKRLLYFRQEGASERVVGFFENLHAEGIVYTPYRSSEFADRFGRDLQRITGELASSPTARRAPAPASLVSAQTNRNPYRGLKSYTVADAAVFNGRSRETSDLRDLMAADTHGFLVVVGASGSGKSSLVRAGLFRRLQLDGIPGSSTWPLVECRLSPGEAPLRTLAGALLNGTAVRVRFGSAAEIESMFNQAMGVETLVDLALRPLPAASRLIFFVDQFEELFTLVTKGSHRHAFLEVLHALALQPRVHVLVTLRADFYPRLLEPQLSTFLEGHRAYWLKPLDDQALVAATYWPALVSGFRFEDNDLFVQVLRDAGGSAGALPLLSFALEQLAERAEQVGTSLVMTWSAYKRIGRVQGVVQEQVDEAMRGLRFRPSRETLSTLFRHLVTVDENGTPRKAPATFDEADPSWTPESIQLVHALVDKRLLRATASTGELTSRIEIAHDALLNSWEDLKIWIEESHSALLLIQSMERAARDWARAREQAPDLDARLSIDRERLWTQERIDGVCAALKQLGKAQRELSPETQAFLRPEFERLVEELEQPVGYERRAQIGERLASPQLGDRRKGVGLLNGLPDIAWCPVPGGTVTIPDVGTESVGPFRISMYPVSLKQFEVFTQRHIYSDKRWWSGLPIEPNQHPTFPQRPAVDNHPAQFVSWFQAIAFCNWLSSELGYPVRLPTEWEWVQAATGGNGSWKYPWGPEWDETRANHRYGAYRLMSVGMYPEGRSPAGAFDMVGNMYQWCLNEYDHPERTEPSTEPRTTRGGAFFSTPPDQFSVDHRLRDPPDGQNDLGKRVAVCMRLVTEHVADLPAS
jgi:hypothetical protein